MLTSMLLLDYSLRLTDDHKYSTSRYVMFKKINKHNINNEGTYQKIELKGTAGIIIILLFVKY